MKSWANLIQSFYYYLKLSVICNIVLVLGVQHSDSVFLQIILNRRLLQNDGYNSLCYLQYILVAYLFYT